MDKEQYFKMMEQELTSLQDLIKRKNNDYTAGGGPFDNFNVTAALDLADRRTGLLIRMVDKIQRLKTFIKKGELKVQGESAKDAARDIIGYSLILLGMLTEDEQAKPTTDGRNASVDARIEEIGKKLRGA